MQVRGENLRAWGNSGADLVAPGEWRHWGAYQAISRISLT